MCAVLRNFFNKTERLTNWYPFKLKQHKEKYCWFLLMISGIHLNKTAISSFTFFFSSSPSLSLSYCSLFFFHILWMANQNRRRCSLIVINNLLSFQTMVVGVIMMPSMTSFSLLLTFSQRLWQCNLFNFWLKITSV